VEGPFFERARLEIHPKCFHAPRALRICICFAAELRRIGRKSPRAIFFVVCGRRLQCMVCACRLCAVKPSYRTSCSGCCPETAVPSWITSLDWDKIAGSRFYTAPGKEILRSETPRKIASMIFCLHAREESNAILPKNWGHYTWRFMNSDRTLRGSVKS
jgi:hypothetical protein